MGERKLATLRIIDEIRPIEGADLIELAIVGGWHSVVKKGEFGVGDEIIYCEIDSWIPQTIAPFLCKGEKVREYEGVKGERLRTVKLRGQLSQGLILPISVIDQASLGRCLSIGEDVSEILGIIKYEPPIPAQLAGDVVGMFPSFVFKTDEERIQNISLKKLDKNALYYVTEKLDGSSMTVFSNEGEFGVCSRNLQLKQTLSNTFWKVALELDLETKLKALGRNLAIQGELVGPGIQKNRYGLSKQIFVPFTVFDIDKSSKVGFEEFKKVCESLDLATVPIISYGMLLPSSIDEILEFAEGKSVFGNKVVEREGLVFRSLDSVMSFKAISNKFLLKLDD